MRDCVAKFVISAVNLWHVAGKDVIESGAMDFNGSARPYIEQFQPRSYIGTDMLPGPGVDLVCKAEDLPINSADYVIALEMLEHAENWREAVLGLCRALRPGGYLLITVPDIGFPKHSYPHDYWRYPVKTLRQIFIACGMEVIRCESNDQLTPMIRDGEEVTINYPATCALGKKVGAPDFEALAVIEPGVVVEYPVS